VLVLVWTTETEMVEWISALEGAIAKIVKQLAGVDDSSSTGHHKQQQQQPPQQQPPQQPPAGFKAMLPPPSEQQQQQQQGAIPAVQQQQQTGHPRRRSPPRHLSPAAAWASRGSFPQQQQQQQPSAQQQQQQRHSSPAALPGFGSGYDPGPAGSASAAVSPAALVHRLRMQGSELMSADEINYILRIQHMATHGGQPYLEDFYYQVGGARRKEGELLDSHGWRS